MLLWIPACLWGQEQLGIRSSNYGGINATLVNPSAHLSSPFAYDINILEVAQHFSNNYAYLENVSLPEILTQAGKRSFYAAGSEDDNGQPGPEDFVLDYYDDGKDRYGFNVTRLLGPSFFTALNENHVVGLLTRFRAVGSGTSVPDNLSFYKWNNRALNEEFEADPFQGALFAAGELGLNYLYRQRVPGGWLGVGLTAKYLFGLEGYFIDSPDHLTLLKPSSEELTSEPFTMDFSLTNSALQASGYQPSLNGGGFGLDLGVTYAIDHEDGSGYSWKLGAALLDLGWIRYRKQAQVHRIETANTQTINSEVYADLRGPADLEASIRRLSQQLYGDPDATLQDDRFSMGLPTALSLQADRYLGDQFFVNGLLVLPIPLTASAPRRGPLLAVTPRVEKRWWGLAMPVLWQNWRDVRIGASLRLGPLWLGTDDLGSLFPNSRFDSVDLYAALKFNPFARSEGRAQAKSRRKKLQCYTF